MKDSRTSTSSQRFSRTFETLLKIPESEINAISVVRSERFPTGNSGNIPVSVHKMVYGSKTAGVGNSPKPLDKYNGLLNSSKEALGPRENKGPSEGLDTHVLQRTSPKYKSLVEKSKYFVRGPEDRFRPRE
ncbi:hypothetical protein O181_021366 [Austropuccinia psidii MF-1]|uniref:Uncharacterized protein n=1 Tax=Austropuccinia psidii MF-1 TaxID=1389203 RepID=A0A9Q3CAW3_9BASI|nr:hypothetical protein [Austropuccinia psidii MF-1]